MSNISPTIHTMITGYLSGLQPPREYRGPKLHVDHLVSKVSVVYEKIRNSLEYQEEHLIRRSAIERGILRRWAPKKSAQALAKSLIYDLVRGRYLPNDQLPETDIDEVGKIINKHILLANLSKHFVAEKKDKEKITTWLISLCACEIEDYFAPPIKEKAMINGMYEVFHEYVSLADKKITPQDRDIQVYIAIMYALMKYDNTLVAWNLFKHYCPEWLNFNTDEMAGVAKKIMAVKQQIQNDLAHPIGEKVVRFMQRHTIIFWIIQDVIEKNKTQSLNIFANQNLLEKEIIEACAKKYKLTRSKRRRSTLRSFIYIFLTKMMLAIALEIPYDLYVIKHTEYLPISINILFHPFLLFFVASSVRMPKADNTQKIVQSINTLVYKPKDTQLYQIKTFKPTKTSLKIIFFLLYTLMFAISFGAIVYILRRLNFNVVSGLLFLFFIAVISFFGLKMRQMVRELILIKKKEGFISRMINFLSLPILRAGRWLSRNIRTINLLVFILDYIIERPFKKTMEVSEEFVEYVKEKEEEVY
jgi:hypothetical protein